MLRGTSLLAAIALATACGREHAAQADSAAATVATSLPADTLRASLPPGMPPDSLCDDFVDHGFLLPEPRDSVISMIGNPDSASSRPEKNRHVPGQTDSIVDLYFAGLHLNYYVVSANGRTLLVNATLTDNRHLKYPALGIGATGSALIAALGEPLTRSSERYTYDCGREIGYESPVHFNLRNGIVSSIEFTYVVD